jgi:nitrite reductase/ring-hydroxylating ferredoxin subunit
MTAGSTTWVPVGHAAAVRRRPLASRAGGEEIVLFRDGGGAVRALEDRCCHRRVPLSLGRLTDAGALQCGYHGWCFAGDGACVAIPQLRPGEPVPARFGVRSFPVAERAGLVWVLPCSGGVADEAQLPDTVAVSPLPGRLGRGRFASRLTPEAWAARAVARAGARATVHEPTGTVTVDQPMASSPRLVRLTLAPAPGLPDGAVVWWVAGFARQAPAPDSQVGLRSDNGDPRGVRSP